MTSLTNQQVYDNALYGIREQKYQLSRGEFSPICRYRAYDGKRCAIGWSIPDNKYRPGWEGLNVTVVIRDLQSLFKNVDPRLMADLQHAHDKWLNSPEEFEGVMLSIACVHNLEYCE